jgi:hypothetical protein
VRRIAAVFGLVVGISLLVVPRGAVASCAADPTMRRAITDARLLFVGTVVDTTNSDRWALVDVEEVWKGTDVPPRVSIKAGPRNAWPFMSMSSTDRHFREDTRYLFFPYGREGAEMQDNDCTSTTVYGPRLDRFRPEVTFEPTGVAVPPRDALLPFRMEYVALAVLCVGLFALFRRYHRRHESSGF